MEAFLSLVKSAKTSSEHFVSHSCDAKETWVHDASLSLANFACRAVSEQSSRKAPCKGKGPSDPHPSKHWSTSQLDHSSSVIPPILSPISCMTLLFID
jgi:hypothetical protein